MKPVSFAVTDLAINTTTTFELLNTDANLEDGPIDVAMLHELAHFELYIDIPLGAPAAGTGTLSVRPRGSAEFRPLKTDIDMTAALRDYEFEVTDVDAIRFVDASVTAGTVYDLRLKCRKIPASF